ncbi:MAG: glycerate kinase type-2 family protein [Candidatus Bipolaricaulota bacterium]
MTRKVRIKNRSDLLESGSIEAKELALELFEEGINSALPGRATRDHIGISGRYLISGRERYNLDEIDRIFVLGGGKASLGMAKALDELLGPRISCGLVIVKEGEKERALETIKVVEAGHPVPDKRGVRATGELLEIARSAGSRDLVVCLISGGGSALMTSPLEGIKLDHVRELTDQLLQSGASIDEINTVRKHLSEVKGGRLARAIHPANVLSLIASDVVGDHPGFIASGPTAPESSDSGDALNVLKRYGLQDRVSNTILNLLKDRDSGDPVGPVGEKEFSRFEVENQVIISNMTALSAISDKARELEIPSHVLSTRLEGESSCHGQVFGQLTCSIYHENHPFSRPCVLLSGGEMTVTLTGEDGKGGPNQEFVLAGGLEISGLPKTTIGAIDSDGEDGSTGIAGGILDGSSIPDESRVKSQLRNHDSSPALKELGGSIVTGPTGTNVNDLRLALVL